MNGRVIFFVAMLACFSSCNKEGGNSPVTPVPEGYRMVSEKHYENGIVKESYTYTYEKDRLTQFDCVFFGTPDVSVKYTYGYHGDTVKGTYIYLKDDLITTQGCLDYTFRAGQLRQINEWFYLDNIPHLGRTVKLDYDGDLLSEYVELAYQDGDTVPLKKIDFDYSGGQKLLICNFFEYTNTWYKWETDEYHYIGDKLSEVFIYYAYFGFEKPMEKFRYYYEGNSLDNVQVFYNLNEGWTLNVSFVYYYDKNGNLIRKEQKTADGTLQGKWEYEYELGKSNLVIIPLSIMLNENLIYPMPIKAK